MIESLRAPLSVSSSHDANVGHLSVDGTLTHPAIESDHGEEEVEDP